MVPEQQSFADSQAGYLRLDQSYSSNELRHEDSDAFENTLAATSGAGTSAWQELDGAGGTEPPVYA